MSDAQEAYEDAACGLVSARPDAAITRANRTLLGWLGTSAPPSRLPELFTVPGALFFESHCAPLLRLQGFIAEIAVDLRRPDGNSLPVLLSARLDKHADNSSRSIHAVLYHAPARREYERELQAARRDADQTAQLLRAQAHQLAEQSALLIRVRHDLRVMPLLGAIDPARARRIIQTLLHIDANSGVRAVLIDLTGVPDLDAAAATALRQAAVGLRLRGVRPVLCGLRPAVAQMLTSSAIDLGDITVCGTLEDAIADATVPRPRRNR